MNVGGVYQFTTRRTETIKGVDMVAMSARANHPRLVGPFPEAREAIEPPKYGAGQNRVRK